MTPLWREDIREFFAPRNGIVEFEFVADEDVKVFPLNGLLSSLVV